jgi:hypothetical protein
VLTLDVILRRKGFLNGESTLIGGFPRELRTCKEVAKSRTNEETENVCYDATYRMGFLMDDSVDMC